MGNRSMGAAGSSSAGSKSNANRISISRGVSSSSGDLVIFTLINMCPWGPQLCTAGTGQWYLFIRISPAPLIYGCTVAYLISLTGGFGGDVFAGIIGKITADG